MHTYRWERDQKNLGLGTWRSMEVALASFWRANKERAKEDDVEQMTMDELTSQER
jgi:hypothetical protein